MKLLDRNIIAKGFSRSSSNYDKFARHQSKIVNILISEFSFSTKKFKRILDAGCGTGLLSSLIKNRFEYDYLDCIDISEQMLELASKKLSAKNISMILKDIAEFHPKYNYDLFASSCVLQWLDSPRSACDIVNRLTNPGGKILLAIPVKGTMFEVAQIVNTYDTFPSILSYANEYLNLFEKKINILKSFEEKIVCFYEDVNSIFSAINSLGVNTVKAKGEKPLSITNLRKIFSDYEVYKVNNKYPLTYKVLFLYGEKY